MEHRTRSQAGSQGGRPVGPRSAASGAAATLADNRRIAGAQRELADAVSASPKVVAQSALVRAVRGSPRVVAQARRFEGVLGSAARPGSDAATVSRRLQLKDGRPRAAIAGPLVIERGVLLERASEDQPVQRRTSQVVQRGSFISTQDDNQILQNEYAKYVQDATVKLAGKIGFGASPEGKYDKRYWKPVEDKEYRLAIQATVPPSQAVKQIFEADKDVWSFDCAEFVQICNIYAAMKLYGKEYVDEKQVEPLTLRQHGSTPFASAGVTFERKAKGNKFDVIFRKKNNAYKENVIEEQPLLKSIPAGSRVCFKNPVANDTPFRNENAIAMGGGKYSAHPMGRDLSAEDIVTKLILYNQGYGLGGEDKGASQIFISQVEILPSIPMGNDTLKNLGLEEFDKAGYI